MAGLAYALSNRLNLTNVTLQTAAGNVVMVNEGAVVVNKTVGAATQVTLPPDAGNGGLFPEVWIVDGKGDAATHNITVVPSGSDTINGGSSLVIDQNYGNAKFFWDGTEWKITHSPLSATELAYLDGVTPGTSAPSKAVVVDSSGNEAFTGTVTTTDGVASGSARRVGGVVSSATGVAVHDSSSETVSASVTLPANMIKQGTAIRIHGQVRATATVSTDTLQVKLRFGTTTLTGTALVTGTATDVANGDIFIFEFRLFGMAAPGGTANVVGSGWFAEFEGTTLKPATLTPTSFATNGALLVEATLKWSTTNANSGLVDWLMVEVIG